MKLILSLVILLQMSLAVAHEVSVNARDSKKKLRETLVPVPSTEHFRIVRGDADSPVNPEEDLRAATVLHHLNVARKYFVDVLGARHLEERPEITVRIEMSRVFNENFHFHPDEKQEEFNNALTIPAAGKKALNSVNAWGTEIWFRPMKPVKVDNVVYRSMDEIDRVDPTLLVGPLAEKAAAEAVSHLALSGTLDSFDYMGVLSSLLFTVGALEVLPKVVKFATKDLKSEAYLDTALIPEVIYHEFSHVALSDFVSVRRSTALNEGLANYFAAVINDSARIAHRNGGASRNVTGYNGNAKGMYHSSLETRASGQTNFVFSFLWRLRNRLASDMISGDILSDRLIFAARKHIKYAERPIRDDLLQALRQAIADVASDSEARILRMILTDVALKAGL